MANDTVCVVHGLEGLSYIGKDDASQSTGDMRILNRSITVPTKSLLEHTCGQRRDPFISNDAVLKVYNNHPGNEYSEAELPRAWGIVRLDLDR